MKGNEHVENDPREWRRWDDELVEQFAREVRFLVKVLAGLVLAVCTLVIMKIF
ncbi:MAG: hypothetical protein JRF69_08285 [Deltaproteobacteria bacterium]|nr:hypothetical protein [Deltaproteobacteria bacterium]